jgi:AcrR family transcriptional regulator
MAAGTTMRGRDEGPAGAGEKAGGRRSAGQDPVKRQQIIDGAKRCFLSMGFEAASMNDITAEAGVSKGTLYVYFADKEALFAALCESERKRHLQFAQSELDISTSLEEALTRFGTAITTRLTSNDVIRAMRMVLAVAERMPQLAARFFGPEPFSGIAIIKAYLDGKVAAGELVIEDTEFAGRQFVDLVMAGIFKRRLFGNLREEATPAQIAKMVASGVAMFLKFYRPAAVARAAASPAH